MGPYYRVSHSIAGSKHSGGIVDYPSAGRWHIVLARLEARADFADMVRTRAGCGGPA